MIHQSDYFDVAICGAGMIGLTTACLFAKQGLRIALVNQTELVKWQPDQLSPRVSAINIASINLFKSLDVWDRIQSKRVSPYTNMKVWEHNSTQSISFNASDLKQPYLGCIVENQLICDVLIERVRQNYNAQIFENTALESIEETEQGLLLNHENGIQIKCGLLVGADGARSRVRELSNISTKFHDYQQNAIVSTVCLSGHHQHTAWQAFLPTGPVALLPLNDGRCSIVWSCDRAEATRLMTLDDSAFCIELSQHFQDHIGLITHCEPRNQFPLGQHHAESYIAQRTALVGDAAHITHPLAGLGANIGFIDAAALAQTIDHAQQANLEIYRHSVLRRYERWRKGENALVLHSMKTLKTLFTSPSKLIRTARITGLGLVDDFAPLKNQLAKYAMGISGDLPAYCISS